MLHSIIVDQKVEIQQHEQVLQYTILYLTLSKSMSSVNRGTRGNMKDADDLPRPSLPRSGRPTIDWSFILS